MYYIFETVISLNMIKELFHIYPWTLWSLAKNNNGDSNENGNIIVEENGANVVVRIADAPISQLLALMSPYVYHAPMCSIFFSMVDIIQIH